MISGKTMTEGIKTMTEGMKRARQRADLLAFLNDATQPQTHETSDLSRAESSAPPYPMPHTDDAQAAN